MPTPTLPAPSSSTSTSSTREDQYRTLLNYTSLSAVILCPILIALPPRKLDIYTITLIAGTGLGANHALQTYTGRSINDRLRTFVNERDTSTTARQDRRLDALRKEGLDAREVQREERRAWEKNSPNDAFTPAGKAHGVLSEMERMKAEQQRVQGDMTQEGNEEAKQAPEGWKAQRDKREKEALEEGRGYGDLIMEQVWEVWNWGRKGGEDGDGEKRGEEK